MTAMTKYNIGLSYNTTTILIIVTY